MTIRPHPKKKNIVKLGPSFKSKSKDVDVQNFFGKFESPPCIIGLTTGD